MNDLTPTINNSYSVIEEVEVPTMGDQAKSLLYNRMMDGTMRRQLISRLTIHLGVDKHSESNQDLGFLASYKSIYFSDIDDVSTIPSKGWLV